MNLQNVNKASSRESYISSHTLLAKSNNICDVSHKDPAFQLQLRVLIGLFGLIFVFLVFLIPHQLIL